MSYTSMNTRVLEISKQKGGNTMMLLMHEIPDWPGGPVLQYIVGNYFQQELTACCPRCGKPLDSETEIEEYPYVCKICDENFYAFEAKPVFKYSWYNGEYFFDLKDAVDFWSEETNGK